MIWPKVYRHVTADSIAALLHCEDSILEGDRPDATFYKFGRLLLREEYLAASLDRGLQARSSALICLMTGRSSAYWQATRMFAQRRRFRSPAVAILLKNNIRAIYPQLGLTVKVSNPHEPASSDRVMNEAVNRKKLKDAGGLTVPKITRAGRLAETSFILESLLEDHRPLSADDVAGGFIRRFVNFQTANRTEIPEDADEFSPATAIDRFQSLTSAAGVKIPARLLAFVQATASRTGNQAPRSLCHGDLSRSNILVSGRQFSVIDWEFSHEAPAAIDAIRLATQFPGFAEAYIGELRHPEAMTWFVLGCIHAANEHAGRLAGLEDNRHRRKATGKTARKLSEFIALAERQLAQNR
ncbi:MAG: phosphotransferase [Hyphomicrobiales bacterium]